MKICFRKIKADLRNYITLAGRLRADKRVPRISKLLFAAAVGYFFLPFDLIPDFIPVLGHLDDLLIVPLLIFLAVLFVPRQVWREHYAQVFGNGKE